MAIAGGGPAGCSTALALRRQGISDIVVLEAGSYDAPRVGESLPPDAGLLLRELGVWDDFLREGHEPCPGSWSVWGDDQPGFNDFLSNPHGHGWHLDRRRFDEFLARRAAEAGVLIRCGVRLREVRRSGGGLFRLEFSDGDGEGSLEARFVVDATGPAARVARRLGAVRQCEDRLASITGYMAVPAGVAVTRLTLLEAVEYGWWSAAKMPGRRLAIVVGTDPSLVRRLGLHAPGEWLRRLRETEHVSRRCDGELEGGLIPRTAMSCRLDRSAGEGWLAVGDAAAVYDPISPQGIHGALAGGLEAAGAIRGWFGGDAGAVKGYEARVRARFEEYRRNRDYLYAVEQRWAGAEFWERRTGRVRRPPEP